MDAVNLAPDAPLSDDNPTEDGPGTARKVTRLWAENADLWSKLDAALKHRAALHRHCDEGYLLIDNNLSEGTVRAVAMGRNNWGGDRERVRGADSGGPVHHGLDVRVPGDRPAGVPA
jgi:hypothetical protein